MIIETVYAPVHDAAGWAVEAVAVMYARTAGRETRPILFLNDRHYGDIFATREDARAYILKEPHARPLTAAQVVELAHGRRTYEDYCRERTGGPHNEYFQPPPRALHHTPR